MTEVWKRIEGFEDYLVSNLGRIKSIKWGKEKMMKLSLNKPNGYYKVALAVNGVASYKTVHRLVAEAFLPNPDGHSDINHKDENKLNNLVWVNSDGSIDEEKSNLEWCSHKRNMEKWSTIGHRAHVLQYSKDGKFIKEWKGSADAGRKLGICAASIRRSCKSKYRAGGYIWRYVS